MNVRNVLLGYLLMGALGVCSLSAQSAPILGSLEAPYPAVQSTAHVAGTAYGPGAVAYGPVGTPLELTGSNMGAVGTVQFIPYTNGFVDHNAPIVQATTTFWSSTLIFLTVPPGALTGLVTVTTSEGKTSVIGLPFIVMPGNYAGSCPAFPPNNQLQITTSSLHDGTANQSYSATLNATPCSSGGTNACTWSIVNGSLPSGLSLSASTGTISGTPTSPAGPVDLTFQVADSSSPQSADQAVLSLTIQAPTLTPATVYSYTVSSYDGVGNILQSQDSVMGSWGYSYDSLNRLVTGTPSTGAYSGQYACWSYDAFGNRTAQSLQTSACATPETSVPATVSYNTNNQVTWVQNSAPNGFAYDAAGDVTGDSMNQYTYDAEGRICAVQNTPIAGITSMTGYLYDAEGRRVAKGTITSMNSCDPNANGFKLTESYVLGQNGENLTMLDGSNNWQRTNVYAAGNLIGTYDLISDPNSTSPSQIQALHFQLTDPLGTRRMQVSAGGQPETDIQSLPFGDQLFSFPDANAPGSAEDSTPLHFTGKERDSESGNDYFGARYYASTMGRFLSPDWSPDPDQVPYADLEDPQTLNLYAYAGNNPLTKTDPTGHYHCDPDTTTSTQDDQGNIHMTVTGGACHMDWSDLPMLAGVVGHHFIPRAIWQKYLDPLSRQYQFLDKATSRALKNPRLSNPWDRLHKGVNKQVRELVEDLEREKGKSIKDFERGDFEDLGARLERAGGDIESFNARLANYEPDARSMAEAIMDSLEEVFPVAAETAAETGEAAGVAAGAAAEAGAVPIP